MDSSKIKEELSLVEKEISRLTMFNAVEHKKVKILKIKRSQLKKQLDFIEIQEDIYGLK